MIEMETMDLQQLENGDRTLDIRNVSKNIIKTFIEKYRNNPALWQIKNKNLYNNRNLKRKGLNELLVIWRQYDPDADIKVVKNKIQSIRGSFRKELKKVEKSKSSGSGTDEIYKSQLWYFNLLLFLRDHELPTTSISNIQENEEETREFEEEPSTDEQFQEINETASQSDNIENESMTHVPKKKRKIDKEEQERRALITKCTQVLENKVDEAEAFGHFIGTKFDKIQNREQKMFAETLIIKIMNRAILNQLNSDTDVIDIITRPSTSFSAISAISSPEHTNFSPDIFM